MATWRLGVLQPEDLNLQNQTIRVCYHKTKFLTVITHPLTLKINQDNTVMCQICPPTPQKLKTSLWFMFYYPLPPCLKHNFSSTGVAKIVSSNHYFLSDYVKWYGLIFGEHHTMYFFFIFYSFKYEKKLKLNF